MTCLSTLHESSLAHELVLASLCFSVIVRVLLRKKIKSVVIHKSQPDVALLHLKYQYLKKIAS